MATKEEKFLVSLAFMEKTAGIDSQLNPLDAARPIGLSEKSMKNSINMLAQTNFLKKCGSFVQLTPQGREFVSSFLLL
jgi:hypothetical protein